jgi:hypothetical protein
MADALKFFLSYMADALKFFLSYNTISFSCQLKCHWFKLPVLILKLYLQMDTLFQETDNEMISCMIFMSLFSLHITINNESSVF